MKDSEGSTGKGRKRKEKKEKKESSSPRCNTLIPPGLRRTYSYSTKTYEYSDKIPKTPQRQDTQAKVGMAITKYDSDIITTNPNNLPTGAGERERG